MVWYSHLFKNFPQLVELHTVKGFSVVNETEVDVFLEFPCFFHDPTDVDNLISLVPLPYLNPACTSGNSSVQVLVKPNLKDFEHDLASM